MDYVYICRDGDNEELRYSIRSVVANGKPDKIWVVGGKPDWYSGNFIEVPQDKEKYENSRNNIKAIANSKDISNCFVLMNDDFFIISPINYIETYHGGTLSDKIGIFELHSKNSFYTKLLLKTEKVLNKWGIYDPLDYAIHVPMVMEKDKLKDIINTKIEGVSIRTLYGNKFNVGGEKIKDVKIHANSNIRLDSYDFIGKNFPYISTNDDTFEALYDNLLNNMFKKKTKYEND